MMMLRQQHQAARGVNHATRHRPLVARAAAPSTTTPTTTTTAAAELLSRVSALGPVCRDAQTGEPVPDLSALLRPARDGERVALLALSHFGDLTSTEFAQRIARRVLPALGPSPQFPPSLARKLAADTSSSSSSSTPAPPPTRFVIVGLGTPAAARLFARETGLQQALERQAGCPPASLLATEAANGLFRRALGLDPGFAPDTPLSPYAKLLVMLAGLGPDKGATLKEVIRGYAGDKSSDQIFLEGRPETTAGIGGLFRVVGQGYQRPFELATQRLQNMSLVLGKWGELAPQEGSDGLMLVQQGGAFVLAEGGGAGGGGGGEDLQIVFSHRDAGILLYADTDALTLALMGRR